MADAEDPKRNRPPSPVPGQPLPRMWKADPEEEEDDSPKRDRRARRGREKDEAEAAKAEAESASKPKAKPKAKPTAKKAAKGAEKGKGKGVLLEETPELDTHETREKIRMAIGGVLGVAIVGLIIYVMQGLKGPEYVETGLVDEGAAGAASVGIAPTAAKLAGDASQEVEATNVLATARQLAKNGKNKESIAVLEKIGKSYPKTKVATLAKAALDRPKQNLPLFVDEGVVVASAPTEPKANAAPTVVVAAPSAAVVTAVDANNNATIAVGKMPPSDATVHLPANTGETPRAPSEGSAASKGKVSARPLPAGFHIEAESGVHATGWPYQIVGDRDGAILVLVPGGTFTIGRDDGTPDEGPEHKVKLTSFYIDQHEVTNRQYDLYLKETNRRRAVKAAAKELPKTRTEEDPVTGVTLGEAKAYCEWAGKALPSEVQWEAAARSSDGRLYPWGSSEPTWAKPRAPRQIEPVGTYPLDQSPFGTIDMAGNAWEWTADWFDSKYYQSIKEQVLVNPKGPRSSRAIPPQVVVKGGSKRWVAAWREGLKAETKLPYVGFRGVLVVETATEVAAPAAAAAPGQAPVGGTTSPPPAKPGGFVPF